MQNNSHPSDTTTPSSGANNLKHKQSEPETKEQSEQLDVLSERVVALLDSSGGLLTKHINNINLHESKETKGDTVELGQAIGAKSNKRPADQIVNRPLSHPGDAGWRFVNVSGSKYCRCLHSYCCSLPSATDIFCKKTTSSSKVRRRCPSCVILESRRKTGSGRRRSRKKTGPLRIRVTRVLEQSQVKATSSSSSPLLMLRSNQDIEPLIVTQLASCCSPRRSPAMFPPTQSSITSVMKSKLLRQLVALVFLLLIGATIGCLSSIANDDSTELNRSVSHLPETTKFAIIRQDDASTSIRQLSTAVELLGKIQSQSLNQTQPSNQHHQSNPRQASLRITRRQANELNKDNNHTNDQPSLAAEQSSGHKNRGNFVRFVEPTQIDDYLSFRARAHSDFETTSDRLEAASLSRNWTRNTSRLPPAVERPSGPTFVDSISTRAFNSDHNYAGATSAGLKSATLIIQKRQALSKTITIKTKQHGFFRGRLITMRSSQPEESPKTTVKNNNHFSLSYNQFHNGSASGPKNYTNQSGKTGADHLGDVEELTLTNRIDDDDAVGDDYGNRSQAHSFTTISITSDPKSDLVAAFLGIRYGLVPEKQLRFMPPSPYFYGPNQLHDLTQWAPICRQRWPQFPVSTSKSVAAGAQSTNSRPSIDQVLAHWRKTLPKRLFGHLAHQYRLLSRFNQSEDCLNLNVFVPHKVLTEITSYNNDNNSNSTTDSHSRQPIINSPNGDEHYQQAKPAQVPVLVLVHGQSFDFGSGNAFDALQFVRRKQQQLHKPRAQIIVITLNYRLNLLGFPPKLQGISSGNLGVLDIVAALIWIQANIASFGGASSRVTLFGSGRAGGALVNLLMVSPLAKDFGYHNCSSHLIASHIDTWQPDSFNDKLIDCLLVYLIEFYGRYCDCLDNQIHISISLFKRAIVEDGSALSPLWANQVQSLSPPTSLASSYSNSKSMQYLRILAKLNECSGSVSARQSTNANQAPGNSNRHSQTIGGQHNAQMVEHKQQPQIDPVSAFDCLKRRPIEALMQRVQLPLETMVHSNNQASWPMSTSTNNHSMELLLSSFEQLPPATQTVNFRPAFGLSVDQMLLPGTDDLASVMLNSSQSSLNQFGQLDLLIGFSSESPLPTVITRAPNVVDNTKEKNNKFHGGQSHLNQNGLVDPSHFLINMLDHSLESHGLSKQEAMDLLRNFVRSFYRYHDQEIMNALIEHYPLRLSSFNSNSNNRKFNNNQPPASSTVTNSTSGPSDNPEHQQRLALLESIMEAFQDSMVRIPLLRTAMIHSLQQLDKQRQILTNQLIKLFTTNNNDSNVQIFNNDDLLINGDPSRASDASQQVHLATSPHQLYQASRLASLLEPAEIAQNLLELSTIQRVAAMQTMIGYNAEDNIKQLNQADAEITNRPIPSSTYLYQTDPGKFFNLLEQSIGRLERSIGTRRGENNEHNNQNHLVWSRHLKPKLNGMLAVIANPEFPLKLGLACSFDSQLANGDASLLPLNDDSNSLSDGIREDTFDVLGSYGPATDTTQSKSTGNDVEFLTASRIAVRVNNWLCSGYDSILRDFTSVGQIFNSNNNHYEFLDSTKIESEQSEKIELLWSNYYTTNCFQTNNNKIQDNKQGLQLDLAPPTDPNPAFVNNQSGVPRVETSSSASKDEKCNEILFELALELLQADLLSNGFGNYATGNHLDQSRDIVDGESDQEDISRVWWPQFVQWSTRAIAVLPEFDQAPARRRDRKSQQKSRGEIDEDKRTGLVANDESFVQLLDSSKELDQRSSFAARSAFWLNSLPALNCSRTQPISTADLAHSYLNRVIGATETNGGDDSPLMSLNLAFNCQTGAKTSYDVIHSILISIRQTVSKAILDYKQEQAREKAWKQVEEERLQMDNGLSSSSSVAKARDQQNHHSLRMTNSTHNSFLDDINNSAGIEFLASENFSRYAPQPGPSVTSTYNGQAGNTAHPTRLIDRNNSNPSQIYLVRANLLLLSLGFVLMISSLIGFIIWIRQKSVDKHRTQPINNSNRPPPHQAGLQTTTITTATTTPITTISDNDMSQLDEEPELTVNSGEPNNAAPVNPIAGQQQQMSIHDDINNNGITITIDQSLETTSITPKTKSRHQLGNQQRKQANQNIDYYKFDIEANVARERSLAQAQDMGSINQQPIDSSNQPFSSSSHHSNGQQRVSLISGNQRHQQAHKAREWFNNLTNESQQLCLGHNDLNNANDFINYQINELTNTTATTADYDHDDQHQFISRPPRPPTTAITTFDDQIVTTLQNNRDSSSRNKQQLRSASNQNISMCQVDRTNDTRTQTMNRNSNYNTTFLGPINYHADNTLTYGQQNANNPNSKSNSDKSSWLQQQVNSSSSASSNSLKKRVKIDDGTVLMINGDHRHENSHHGFTGKTRNLSNSSSTPRVRLSDEASGSGQRTRMQLTNIDQNDHFPVQHQQLSNANADDVSLMAGIQKHHLCPIHSSQMNLARAPNYLLPENQISQEVFMINNDVNCQQQQSNFMLTDPNNNNDVCTNQSLQINSNRYDFQRLDHFGNVEPIAPFGPISQLYSNIDNQNVVPRTKSRNSSCRN